MVVTSESCDSMDEVNNVNEVISGGNLPSLRSEGTSPGLTSRLHECVLFSGDVGKLQIYEI